MIDSAERIPERAILPLPDLVRNQIAAGEVVERPVSVIRELVDNAIDAGADEIVIQVRDGGISSIEVADNGCGMSLEDLKVCTEPHFTSKIRQVEDLERITSKGFRGEALASIRSVAKLTIVSRAHSSEVGYKVDFSRDGSIEQISARIGTRVIVEDLFYNMPARKKFLRKPSTELQKIRSWLRAYSLGQPNVRFVLYSNGNESLNIPSNKSLVDRAVTVFKEPGITLENSSDGISVSAYLLPSRVSQQKGASLKVFVNGRMVSDRLIVSAVRDAYGLMLRSSEMPNGVVHVHMPPEMVDVNVHPQKSEVRFRDPRGVFSIVKDIIRGGLERAHISSTVVMPSQRDTGGNWVKAKPQSAGMDVQPSGSVGERDQRELNLNYTSGFDYGEDSKVHSGSVTKGAEEIDLHSLVYIGQAFKCYLMFQGGANLYVLDMHAAHERITFNKLMESYENGDIKSQPLLIPSAVWLGEDRTEALMLRKEELETLGLVIDKFGDDTIMVREIPVLLRKTDLDSLIHELASMDLESSFGALPLRNRVEGLVAKMACHASLRSGDEISREEAYELLNQLSAADTGYSCPHGRPVLASISRTYLEGLFGRNK